MLPRHRAEEGCGRAAGQDKGWGSGSEPPLGTGPEGQEGPVPRRTGEGGGRC